MRFNRLSLLASRALCVAYALALPASATPITVLKSQVDSQDITPLMDPLSSSPSHGGQLNDVMYRVEVAAARRRARLGINRTSDPYAFEDPEDCTEPIMDDIYFESPTSESRTAQAQEPLTKWHSGWTSPSTLLINDEYYIRKTPLARLYLSLRFFGRWEDNLVAFLSACGALSLLIACAIIISSIVQNIMALCSAEDHDPLPAQLCLIGEKDFTPGRRDKMPALLKLYFAGPKENQPRGSGAHFIHFQVA